MNGLPFLLEIRRMGVFGSGGKTSLIDSLARRWAREGERVLITATTKLREFPGVETLTDPGEVPAAFGRGNPVLLVSERDGRGKLHGFPPERIAEFADLADRLLVEGDGARQCSLKIHLPHDPMMPASVDLALMILGAGIVGRPASAETVHRLEKAPADWGLREEEPVDAATVARMALAPEGYRGKAGALPLAILVNQADEFPAESKALAEALRRLWPGPILLGSGRRGEFSMSPAHKSRPALILLAAGSSRRWPEGKLHAELAGRPVLKWSLAVWEDLCLEERLAVVRPGDDEAAAWTLEAGFRPLICEDAHRGQSFSLRAGLEALPVEATGAIIALGDMPALSSKSAAAFLAAIDERPGCVIRTRAEGRQGHPVYLPRTQFEALAGLAGDRGPRELLPALDPFFLDLEDAGAILDLDEPADAGALQTLLEARKSNEA